MKSKRCLYEIVLTPLENSRFEAMPKAEDLEKALPESISSDLFVDGFSHKRIDLGVGFEASCEEQYHHLKRLKGAKIISDRARNLSIDQMICRLEEGELKVENGVIGFSEAYSRAFRTIRLSDSDALFGVELKKGARFRCFVKSKSSSFPETILISGSPFLLQKISPLSPPASLGVLQKKVFLSEGKNFASNPKSRFKLSFDPEKNLPVLCAGSVLDPNEVEGVFIEK